MAKAKKTEAEQDAPEGGAEGEAARRRRASSPRSSSSWSAAGLLVLGGGGGGGYFFFFGKKPHEEKPAPVAVKPPAFFDLPEVLVNLSSAGNGRSQLSQGQDRARGRRPEAGRADQAGDAARDRHVPDLSARDAPERPRRLGRALSAAG